MVLMVSSRCTNGTPATLTDSTRTRGAERFDRDAEFMGLAGCHQHGGDRHIGGNRAARRGRLQRQRGQGAQVRQFGADQPQVDIGVIGQHHLIAGEAGELIVEEGVAEEKRMS